MGRRMVVRVAAALVAVLGTIGAATSAATAFYPWERVNVYPWALEDSLVTAADADGHLDLVGLGPGGVLFAEGDGLGGFENPRVLIPGSYQALERIPSYPNGEGVGGIVLITDEASPRMVVYMLSTAGFNTTADVSIAGEQPQVAAGDFDIDGTPDLATLRADGRAALVRYGLGDGTFTAPKETALSLPSPPPGQQQSVAHLMAARRNQLVVATDDAAGNGSIYSLLGKSDRTLTQVEAGVPAQGATAMALGDVTRGRFSDSPPDLAMSAGGRLLVYWGNGDSFTGRGDGTFSGPPAAVGDGSGATEPVIADLFPGGPGPDSVVAGVGSFAGIVAGRDQGTAGFGWLWYDDGPAAAPTADERVAVGEFFEPVANGAATFAEVAYPSGGTTIVQVVPFVPTTDITFRPQPEIYTHHTHFDFRQRDQQYVTFECRFDSNVWRSCASGDDLGWLDVGDHHFEVRGRAAKWVDPTPETVDFRVARPETSITSGPPPLSTNRYPVFTWISNADQASFECALDSQPFHPCNHAVELGPLKPGWHAFQVRARTEADLVDQIPDAWGFTVVKRHHHHPGHGGGGGGSGPPEHAQLELSVTKTRIPDDRGELVDRGAAGQVVCNLDCVATMKLVAEGSAARRMDFDGVIGHDRRRLGADGEGKLVALPRRAVAEKLLHPTVSGTLRLSLRFGAERAGN